jgi:HEAT repeat protein
MLDGVHDIDWSAMNHAYGSAENVPALLVGLRSPEPEVRRRALSDFYSMVHHQGDVSRCTTASLPFLFELAGDVTTADRSAIVELLVSIGTSAVEHGDVEYFGDDVDFTGSARVMRERGEMFIEFTADVDRLVRRAAIPGLGLFLDDTDRATVVLRDRLRAESGIVERLLVVEAMATLALRESRVFDEATAWLTMLAADTAIDPETRLAALVQRARCAPDEIGEDVVPAAIGLLRQARDPAPADWSSPAKSSRTTSDDAVPPQIVAAFEALERDGRVHAPTTVLLRTFHQALDARVSQRTQLLAAQLRSSNPGACLDAIRMAADLMEGWRGDHTSLITRVADHVGPTHDQVTAQAAVALYDCHPIAGPARELLATYVTTHGPDAWASPRTYRRRAYQESVRALASLGDGRAAPSVVAALDGGVDIWRAIEVAGALREAAHQLVPRLCDHLHRANVADRSVEMSVRSMLSALSALGDPTALPVITDTLVAAVGHQASGITCSALQALEAFGPAAAPALNTIRSLTTTSDPHVRPAAVTALWAIGRDQAEAMPLLQDLLEGNTFFWITKAADVLAEIGPSAAVMLPRLRARLTDNYEWVRVHCGTALWDIGGDAEAATVLPVLIQAWDQNSATANHVGACLDRMGHAAEPALPRVRSELGRVARGGWFTSITNDEELQRLCRTIIERFA